MFFLILIDPLFHNPGDPNYQYGGLVITQFTDSSGMVLRTDKVSPQITVFIISSNLSIIYSFYILDIIFPYNQVSLGS